MTGTSYERGPRDVWGFLFGLENRLREFGSRNIETEAPLMNYAFQSIMYF